MQIEERSAGDVMILDLKGKMTLGEGDEVLKDKINSLVLQGRKKLVLNLAAVPYIDSAGLGEIVRTYTTLFRSRRAAGSSSIGRDEARPRAGTVSSGRPRGSDGRSPGRQTLADEEKLRTASASLS